MLNRSLRYGFTSRDRERHADKFATQLTGHDGLVSALRKLRRFQEPDVRMYEIIRRMPFDTHPSDIERERLVAKELGKLADRKPAR